MLVPLAERECYCVLCQPQASHDELNRRDAVNTKFVAEYGWVAIGVAGDPRGWAYTIGLWHTFGSPEVCIIGMDHNSAARYVNTVAEQIKGGKPLIAREIRTGVLGGWDDTLATAPVHNSWYDSLFGGALGFYRRPPIPVLQLVWPDGYGRFLWDPEVDPGTRELQPELYLPREEAAEPWHA